jgi:hypothetical protein
MKTKASDDRYLRDWSELTKGRPGPAPGRRYMEEALCLLPCDAFVMGSKRRCAPNSRIACSPCECVPAVAKALEAAEARGRGI